jgi:hypothetical protein
VCTNISVGQFRSKSNMVVELSNWTFALRKLQTNQKAVHAIFPSTVLLDEWVSL